jgi:hypothetical protein
MPHNQGKIAERGRIQEKRRQAEVKKLPSRHS